MEEWRSGKDSRGRVAEDQWKMVMQGTKVWTWLVRRPGTAYFAELAFHACTMRPCRVSHQVLHLDSSLKYSLGHSDRTSRVSGLCSILPLTSSGSSLKQPSQRTSQVVPSDSLHIRLGQPLHAPGDLFNILTTSTRCCPPWLTLTLLCSMQKGYQSARKTSSRASLPPRSWPSTSDGTGPRTWLSLLLATLMTPRRWWA